MFLNYLKNVRSFPQSALAHSVLAVIKINYLLILLVNVSFQAKVANSIPALIHAHAINTKPNRIFSSLFLTALLYRSGQLKLLREEVSQGIVIKTEE